MSRYFYFIILVSSTCWANPTQPLHHWTLEQAILNTADLDRDHVVRANFVQKKIIPALHKPLVSKGHFVFAKKHGLLMETEDPFSFILAISSEGIIQWNQGVPRKQEDPITQHVGNWIARILNGDVTALSLDFDILGGKQGNIWTLALLPKTDDLKKILRRIQFEGRQTISKLDIDEVSGVSTQIQFSNAQIEGADLPPEDLRYFEISRKP